MDSELQRIDAELDLALRFIEEQQEEGDYHKVTRLIEARQRVLAALYQTELGLNRQWLQQCISRTQQFSVRAQRQLAQSKNRLGGYRKGRGQVLRYQQVQAGKG